MSENSKPLASQVCIPCSGSMPPATAEEIAQLLTHLSGWSLIQADGVSQLQKQYRFKTFRQALAFTNAVGEVAESAGHHPALLTEWGKVTVTWWTHAINGLHQNDFVMAAKTDAIAAQSVGLP
ncbi:MAG: 4a-hydroxytetrahydrobiopterin dehydratase [Leptolyngbya foveolarum]|uniref:Putative pterin-4-alpha-carbinolamine dehydratase n=1 Tax=Leptolyngbya foveolarum TaxID=47253 RepID=A0A2W4VJ28_9CYAN|nr:MAG: 4a-hydroxytetrahydrobiopterin dehydratase [Leptolyngbya foveolarum]